jgi:hypothetical protein
MIGLDARTIISVWLILSMKKKETSRRKETAQARDMG